MDHLTELRQKPIWVNYIRVWSDKKQGYGKPPINPRNLYNASTTNPEHWTDYQTAAKNIGKPGKIYQNGELIAEQPVEGVGLVLARPLTGIDFDHVRDPETGEIQPFAKKIVEELDSYTEISPSGSGLHILIYDEESEDLAGEFKNIAPDGSISKTGTAEIDAYNHRRFFTMTENMLLDKPIQKTSGALRKILTEYNKKKRKASGTEQPKQTSSPVVSGVSQENLRRMIESALQAIPSAELSFGEWIAVGSALKQLGFSCGVWEEWSRRNGNPKHVNGYTFKRWNKLQTKDEPERLILGLAKRFGWNAANTFSVAERWSYGRNMHTPEERAEYARQKATEEAQRGVEQPKALDYRNLYINEDGSYAEAPTASQSTQEMKQEPPVEKIKPIGDYVDGFIAECKNPKPRHSTGFLSLDKRLNGGLFNELYILNAETSTGKSAIAMTIAQNMARNGVKILYFALEMSKNEFIARGASAISWEKTENPEEAVTASDILYYHFNEGNKALGVDPFEKVAYSKYAEYVEEYRNRYANNLYIIERPQIREHSEDRMVSGENIANLVRRFREIYKDEPLAVFVDYLQILEGKESDRKTKTDKNISDLKDLCTQEKIPVFTISSIGRSGYRQGADLGNAKESGDIEYTTGVAIGWDWDGVTNWNTLDADRKKRSVKEQKRLDREVYHNRLMRMSLLKYRNSERDTQDGIIYYPQYNYFREIDDELDAERIDDIKALGKVDIDDLLLGRVTL